MSTTRSDNETSGPVIKTSWKNSVRDFISNVGAGFGVAATTFPAESLKKRLQTNQTEKFVPYRGFGIFVFNVVPTTTVQLITDSYIRKHVIPKDDNSLSAKLLSAGYAGAQGALVATLVENTIVRQQVMKVGPMLALQDMLKVGLLRPLKSYPLIAGRDASFVATMLCLNDEAKECAVKNFGHITPFAATIASFMVGTAGAFLSHPLDTVASNLQKTHDKISISKAFQSLYQAHGIKGFFAGIGPRFVLYHVFMNAIPWTRDFINKGIEPYLNDDDQKTISLGDFSLFAPVTPAEPAAQVEESSILKKDNKL